MSRLSSSHPKNNSEEKSFEVCHDDDGWLQTLIEIHENAGRAKTQA